MLFTLLLALTAQAAPLSGLKNNEQLIATFVSTDTAGFERLHGNEATGLCLAADFDAAVSRPKKSGAFALGAKTKTSGHPCTLFNESSFAFEPIREFTAADNKKAYWNVEDNGREHPQQLSFRATVSGKEINDAYARLVARCAGHTCGDYRLLFITQDEGMGLYLPLERDLELGPAALVLNEDPTQPHGFHIVNAYLRVTPAPKPKK